MHTSFLIDGCIKKYERTEVDQQVEVISLVGDIAEFEGRPVVLTKVVVVKRDGTAYGGRLMDAVVRPTLEIILTESHSHLTRRYDPNTHLPLIEF